ncbi:Protein MNN4 [Meyerozyma sp. JA9]|nr:Protein MNN4 [Meyerozyma sp. JA9]
MIVHLRRRRNVVAAVVALCLCSFIFLHPSLRSHISPNYFDRLVDQLPFSDSVAHAIDFSAKPNFDTFVLPEYLTSRDGSEVMKYTMPFDPRFTMGMVLDHLANQIQQSKSVYEVHLPYFHWADYSDLSDLNKYYFAPEKDNCKNLFDVTTSSHSHNRKQELVETEQYCLDQSQLEEAASDPAFDEHQQKAFRLAKTRPVSPGWYIFDYGGRSKQSLKILHAKSYLESFMAPPSNLVLLIPTEKGPASITVPVNQDISGRERISQSPLLETYLTSFRLNSPEAPSVSVAKQLQRVSDLVSKYAKVAPLPLTKSLKHEDFTADCRAIIDSLGDTRSQSVQLYKQSLEYSLAEANPPKYFKEAKILKKEANWAHGGHYDWRFFSGLINFTDRQPPVLHGLLQAYLKFTNANNITTWVAHGSLLSWYWNGVAFPWDNDIDVQMPIQDLHRLSQDFNQSMIVDLGGESGQEVRYGRYFIDCGTFISHRTAGNGNNNIDARFIDVDTGFYIDITGLAISDEKAPTRYNDLLPPELSRQSVDATITDQSRNEYLQAYNCRHHHFARLSELSPLSLSAVEGQYAYVPANYERVLMNEYGVKGIVHEVFKIFTFVPRFQLWIATRDLRRFTNNHDIKWSDDQTWKNWREQDYIQFLSQNEELLTEYVATRKMTQLHSEEMKLRRKHKNSEKFVVSRIDKDPSLTKLRHDYFSFLVSNHDYDFRIRDDKVKAEYKELDQALAQQSLPEVEKTTTTMETEVAANPGTNPEPINSPPQIQSPEEQNDATMRRPDPNHADPDQSW